MDSFIHALPKLELHLHLEGSLTPERKIHLALRNGILLDPSTIEGIKATYKFDSLTSFLKIYFDGMKVLLQEEDFYDLAMDYLRKASSQNVRYAEMFFDPQAHTGRGVPFEHIILGLSRACTEAKKSFNIEGKLIMCFLRDHEEGWAQDILTQSLKYKEHIVGVGLDSDERDNPPSKFEDVFARARKEGYKLTMHCDVAQKNGLDHIHQALHSIEVERIDHGLDIIDSPEMTDFIVKKGLGLTMCPVSNGFVVDDMRGSQIKTLLEAGVKVTINSDDPSYMGEKYVEENLVAVYNQMGFSKEQLVQFEKNAVDISWASDVTKKTLMKEIDDYYYSNK
jgi:adenine deaminase